MTWKGMAYCANPPHCLYRQDGGSVHGTVEWNEEGESAYRHVLGLTLQANCTHRHDKMSAMPPRRCPCRGGAWMRRRGRGRSCKVNKIFPTIHKVRAKVC